MLEERKYDDTVKSSRLMIGLVQMLRYINLYTTMDCDTVYYVKFIYKVDERHDPPLK